jgi:hypothetical protein
MVLRRVSILLSAVLSAALLSACGGGEDEGSSATNAPAAAQAPPAQAADFPSAKGKTLMELQEGLPEGPILAPSVSLLEVGSNRLAFGLFDAARKQLSGAQVALYTARPDGSGLRGPFPARTESLAVKPQFQSRQTAEDPDAARGVYVADVPFKRNGPMLVAALARFDGRLVATTSFDLRVGAKGATPPDVGERAPAVETETVADSGGDLSRIDTRIPPVRELHEESLVDVLGKRPVVLVFATPQLCQSKVCGPVVDVALQVKIEVGDDVAFIHQEIFRENTIDKGYRPQVAAFKLPSEPWVFVIDGAGIVRERFEGAVSVAELSRAVAKIRG